MRGRPWAWAGLLVVACGGVSEEFGPVDAPRALADAGHGPASPAASSDAEGDVGTVFDASFADTSSEAADAGGDGGATCPEGSIAIPATGPDGFRMMKGREGEHVVVLSEPFCLDVDEVTVRAYKACVDAGRCEEPWTKDPFSMYPSFPDHPVNLVSWDKARAYCAYVGRRLPTEAEWEWAATGPEQYKYPWGNTPEPSCETVDFTKYGAPKTRAGGDVGCHGGGPSKVGTHLPGDRVWPSGHLHDMAGNVWEWVEDSYAPFTKDKKTDPLVRNETPMHPLRGGAWNRSFGGMAITFRAAAQFTYQVPGVGFRCAQGRPHPTPPPKHEIRVPGWKPPKKT